jgi:hypothetical protein
MKTMTHSADEGRDARAESCRALFANRSGSSDRFGWSSQVALTHETANAAVWAMFPAVLGFAVEGLAAGRVCFAVLAVVLHQFAALFLGRRVDGQASTWSNAEWAILAVGAAATVAVADFPLWPWLLLPVGPALLLRSARREQLISRTAGPMRIFSVATFGAVLVQLASAVPATGVAIAALGGTFLYLAGLERLVTGERLR